MVLFMAQVWRAAPCSAQRPSLPDRSVSWNRHGLRSSRRRFAAMRGVVAAGLAVGAGGRARGHGGGGLGALAARGAVGRPRRRPRPAAGGRSRRPCWRCTRRPRRPVPGLPWTVLAAIGTVESDNGQSTLPGVHSGANAAGAEGPMQFEPATFAAYDEPVPPGGADPPSPYDPTDAVYAAARLLCANGAAGRGRPARRRLRLQPLGGLRGAGAGAGAVLRRRRPAADAGRRSGAGAVAGGLGPRADRHALRLGRRDARAWASTARGWSRRPTGWPASRSPGWPRTSTTPRPSWRRAQPLAPGDLVFFGGGPGAIDHVGLYAGVVGGDDVMVDAPHTGADVRAEAFPATVGRAVRRPALRGGDPAVTRRWATGPGPRARPR